MTRELHKKFFATLQMPWHDDDHKFGESVEGAAVEEKDVIHIFHPPPIDANLDKIQEMLRDRFYEADHTIGPLDSTIYLVEDGVCHICGDHATTGFRGKIYCSTCWLAWDESYE